MILLAERVLDVLEVLEVGVADGLLGRLGVAFAHLVDRGREHRLDLVDLGHRLGRRGGLLVGFVGAAAAGDGERGRASETGGSTGDSLRMDTFLC